jgi:DNA-binding response OmpR family regulator
MSKAKILVIDDEPAILNLVTAYLRSEGYEYYTAPGGAGYHAARDGWD